ncbi:hypothetical protein LJC20_04855 [Eubacteriales bacterium OttesenSCG-928-M02]|nr:hypothetical protein [Eubacteriales bacterium OttesenSCG-928-M02]
MKKAILCLAFLFVFGTFYIPVAANDGLITYPVTLSDLTLSVKLPQDILVITASDIHAPYGLNPDFDLEAHRAWMAEYDILLHGFYASPQDASREILVIATEDDHTRYVIDFSLLSAEEFQAYLTDFENLSRSNTTVTMLPTYTSGAAKYIVADFIQTASDATRYSRQYYTVHEAKAVSFFLDAYDAPIDDYDLELLRYTVDQVSFSKRRIPWATIFLSIGAFLLLGAFLFFRNIRNQSGSMPEELDHALVNKEYFSGETFTFNGRYYDKNKYMRNRIQRIKGEGYSEKRLQKQLEKATKRSLRYTPPLTLDALELEAIRTVLEERTMQSHDSL